MKKIVFILIAAIAVLASCNDYETYGDMKEKSAMPLTSSLQTVA